MLSVSMWAALLGAFAVAVVSPGPDFLLVLRTSLQFGRQHGVATAVGIAAGTAVWITATMAGLAAILHLYPTLAVFTRLAGAGLLAYLGVRILWSAWQISGSLRKRDSGSLKNQVSDSPAGQVFPEGAVPSPSRTVGSPLWLGFATTTVGNPKAVVFFSSLFASMLPQTLLMSERLILGTLMVLTSFSWFVLVASVAGNKRFRQGYEQVKTPVDIGLGILFLVLALVLVR